MLKLLGLFPISKSEINLYIHNMDKHKIMRPHDVIILMKIILSEKDIMLKDISASLGISASEVTKSINRSTEAGLIAEDKKTVMRKVFYEFLLHGLSVVFPTKPSSMVRGMPTAHSAPPLNKEFESEEAFVWADPKGNIRGQQITPFHPNQVQAAKSDERLYEMLALVDALRVGKTREKEMAKEELQKRILG